MSLAKSRPKSSRPKGVASSKAQVTSKSHATPTGKRASKNTAQPVIRLEQFLPYQIAVIADRLARQTTMIVKGEGLSLTQWRVMAAVADKPGRSANEVVAVTPMDKGLVSRGVKSLIDLGLVRRQASQEDGRLAHLFLTKRGEVICTRLQSAIAPLEAQILLNVSYAEEQTLRRVMDGMAQI